MASPFSVGTLTYNGIDIDISVILEHSHESFFDGPNFAFTRHTIHIVGHVSLLATNWKQTAGVPPANLDNVGLPVEIDENPIEFVRTEIEEGLIGPEILDQIQEHLSIPRKVLKVQFTKQSARDFDYLVSPKQGMIFNQDDPDTKTNLVSDATAGPFPEVVSIVEALGHKTLRVEFIVKTDVYDKNELYFPSTSNTSNPNTAFHRSRAVLSNTFTMAQKFQSSN